MKYQCQNCPRTTAASEIAARAAQWIIWTGTTVGGQETTRIYCPTCAGRATEDPNPPTWDAECRTCDARMSDEDWDEDEFTEKDARNWETDHQCESDVRLITPEQIEQERLRHAESRARSSAAVGS
jgi:hypothetical protein